MPFNPNVPQPTDNLDDSQGDILNNFQSSNTSFGVDHYTFSDLTANNGRHKDIHIVKRVGNPAAIAGIQGVFTKDYTPDTTGGVADTQLFSITGLGGVSQLTGTSVNGDEGWQWIGGVLIQWGTVTFSAGASDHKTGLLTFKDRVVGAIPFPTRCFCVTATLQIASTGTTTASNTIAIRSKSNTDFRWVYNSSSGSGSTDFPGFYWIAIGF